MVTTRLSTIRAIARASRSRGVSSARPLAMPPLLLAHPHARPARRPVPAASAGQSQVSPHGRAAHIVRTRRPRRKAAGRQAGMPRAAVARSRASGQGRSGDGATFPCGQTEGCPEHTAVLQCARVTTRAPGSRAPASTLQTAPFASSGERMGTAAQCMRCGHEVQAGARFCPGCGLDLQDSRARIATGRLPSNQMLLRRYLIQRRLAQGGQSAVYIVQDTLTGAQRALKEMSDSHMTPAEREKAINDFNREANMLRSLDHPALAKVYDTFTEGQKHFLVMEYVEGHNLEDELIEAGRPLEWRRVLG